MPTLPERDRADQLADAAGDLPPHRRGDDDADAEQAEADTVTPLRGIELLGTAADAAGNRAGQPGKAEPDRAHEG